MNERGHVDLVAAIVLGIFALLIVLILVGRI